MLTIMATKKDIVTALAEADIGLGIDVKGLGLLADMGSLLTLEPGEYLTEEGSEGHHIYFIVSGRVEVQICLDDNDTHSGTLMIHPGSIIGEMSVLEQTQRTASSKVLDSTTLLCMRDQDLWDLFEREPMLGYQFMRNTATILSRRLRMTNLLVRSNLYKD